MKNEEEIRNKLIELSKSLEEYETVWNNCNHTMCNGIPKLLENDNIYITIKNQMEALAWVLNEKIKGYIK